MLPLLKTKMEVYSATLNLIVKEGARWGYFLPPAQASKIKLAGVALGDARDGEECSIDNDFTTSTTTTTRSSIPSMTTSTTKIIFVLAGSRQVSWPSQSVASGVRVQIMHRYSLPC